MEFSFSLNIIIAQSYFKVKSIFVHRRDIEKQKKFQACDDILELVVFSLHLIGRDPYLLVLVN